MEIASSSAPGASKLLLAVVYKHEEGHLLTEFFNVIDELNEKNIRNNLKNVCITFCKNFMVLELFKLENRQKS